jgi:hypothetical protein
MATHQKASAPELNGSDLNQRRSSSETMPTGEKTIPAKRLHERREPLKSRYPAIMACRCDHHPDDTGPCPWLIISLLLRI